MVVQVHLFKKNVEDTSGSSSKRKKRKRPNIFQQNPDSDVEKKNKKRKKSNPDSDSDAEKKNKKRKKSSPATKEIVDYSKSLLTPESVKPTTAYVSPALLQAVKAVRSTKAANPQEPTE